MKPIHARDDFERRIVENVILHGCQVNFIFDPDGDQPSFSYSVGFPESVDQPEIIMFGLPQKVMHFSINETLRYCREGLQLNDWCAVEGLLEGHKCVARAVHHSQIVREYFNSAMWYHEASTGRELTRAVQLFWPGAVNGLFPWDEQCAEEVKQLQPALYEPRYDA